MKQVVILIPNGNANLSSISGAYEILTRANEYWQRIGNPSVMEVHMGGFISELKLDNGFCSVHPKDLTTIRKTDLILIPSVAYDHGELITKNQALIKWIGAQYKNGSEVASMCAGAFLLAATGLLEGKSCATHWIVASEFRNAYPTIDLHVDKLITVDQGIYTNGGAFSFLHLLIFLVERYFDRQTAIFCSKVFQIDIERTSQSPFHIFQTQKIHGDELIGKAQSYIENNIKEKISFEELAATLAISRRNFDRRFVKATGNTPVEYLQRVKIEVAKRTLENGRKSIFEAMHDVGYTDDKSFREVFKRITGLSPLDYRDRFHRKTIR